MTYTAFMIWLLSTSTASYALDVPHTENYFYFCSSGISWFHVFLYTSSCHDLECLGPTNLPGEILYLLQNKNTQTPSMVLCSFPLWMFSSVFTVRGLTCNCVLRFINMLLILSKFIPCLVYLCTPSSKPIL